MFGVKLANFLMFTVSEENTVKCLEGFSWKPHKSFSSAQIAHELWARAQRGCSCSLFFPQRILGNLGSTGYQSRARNPRSFGQRRGRRRNNPGGDGGIEWILLLCCQSYKVIVSFYRSEEDSAFEKHRSLKSLVTFELSKLSSEAAVKKHLREFLGLNELALS